MAMGFANKVLLFGEIGRAYLILGNAASRAAQWKAALGHFHSARQSGYQTAGLVGNMGFAHFNLGDLTAAEASPP